VGDAAIEDDVDSEPAGGGVGRREVEDQLAIEERRHLDAAGAGGGEDQLLLRPEVGDEDAAAKD
jgi:hypothetical protein